MSKTPPSAPPQSPLPTGAAPEGRPLRVLLVDDGARRSHQIREELTQLGHEVVGVIDAALVIHDCVSKLKPDVVIVDSDSPSRDTLEHLATLSETAPRPVVVFAEDDSEDPMRRAMRAGVSAYVVAGLQPHRLAAVMRVAIARFEQDSTLREELGEARAELKSRKLIEQAKAILMAQLSLSEDEAHKHLRRLAMDRGERLGTVAQRVIEAHQLFHPRG